MAGGNIYQQVEHAAREVLRLCRAHTVSIERRPETDNLVVRARWEPSGLHLTMEITGSELHASSGDIHRWIGVLDGEARVRDRRNREYIQQYYVIDPARERDITRLSIRPRPEMSGRAIQAMVEQGSLTAHRYRQELQNQQNSILAEMLSQMSGSFVRDEKAEARAKDLFRMIAGKGALKTLEARKGLPMTGSKGGQYLLHRRMTYCVERVKDKAQLCAVVPNVPLYDHLLGIKFMVEHDEPAFLKTANVSRAGIDAEYQFREGDWNEVRLNVATHGTSTVRMESSADGVNWAERAMTQR